MPELPEVETVCRGIAGPLTGARITHAAAHRADLRAPLPARLGQRLTGHRITAIRRRAKYILIDLDSADTLLMHLGMSGRILLGKDDAPLQKHDHISLAFDNGWHLRFNDPRRFGYCDLVATAALEEHRLLRHLGVEPLAKAFTVHRLRDILGMRNSAVKSVLMDQSLIVGIGNIYACEALFAAHIDPRRPAGSMTADEIAKLAPAIRAVLRRSIEAGGSSLRDYVQANGETGFFQKQFAVYGRTGEPCPGCTCDPDRTGGVQRITQQGRSTFFCPVKQS